MSIQFAWQLRTTNSQKLFEKYKKLFPNQILERDVESVFTRIYDIGLWGRNEEGRGFSGSGSRAENAASCLSYLREFIKKNEIKTVVDLGCGDWTFSRNLDWDGPCCINKKSRIRELILNS